MFWLGWHCWSPLLHTISGVVERELVEILQVVMSNQQKTRMFFPKNGWSNPWFHRVQGCPPLGGSPLCIAGRKFATVTTRTQGSNTDSQRSLGLELTWIWHIGIEFGIYVDIFIFVYCIVWSLYLYVTLCVRYVLIYTYKYIDIYMLHVWCVSVCYIIISWFFHVNSEINMNELAMNVRMISAIDCTFSHFACWM